MRSTVSSTTLPSLLSILSKVLEWHVHHIISDHLHNRHPISNSQWALQPGKSTVTAQLTTVDNWLRMLDEGSKIGAVFFWPTKGIRLCSPQSSYGKLQQTSLNINILAWVGNCLTFKKQMVVNGSSSSDSHACSIWDTSRIMHWRRKMFSSRGAEKWWRCTLSACQFIKYNLNGFPFFHPLGWKKCSATRCAPWLSWLMESYSKFHNHIA